MAVPTISHFVPVRTSANGWTLLVGTGRLPVTPTATHDVAEVHETETRDLVVLVGVGVASRSQVLASHDSTSAWYGYAAER